MSCAAGKVIRCRGIIPALVRPFFFFLNLYQSQLGSILLVKVCSFFVPVTSCMNTDTLIEALALSLNLYCCSCVLGDLSLEIPPS